MTKPAPITCNRCDHKSVPGMKISGLNGSDEYRVFTCPNCGHIQLLKIASAVEDSAPDA
jgi:predicted RNA-binding Zn-ribbon protein involved in translation (DUF1610 family)